MQQHRDIILLAVVMWTIALYLLFKQNKHRNKNTNKNNSTNAINSKPKYSMFENFLDKKEKEYDVIDIINNSSQQESTKQSKQTRQTKRNSKKQREKYLKKLRKKAMTRDKYQCAKCGSQYNLNMHHKTYKNEPKERLEDVVMLCEECHYSLHTRVGFPQNQHDRENTTYWF